MAEVKGVLLDAWMIFLRQRFGEQAVTKGLEALEPEGRRLLQGPILASSWYPFESFNALRELVRPLAATGKTDIGAEMGRFVAEYAYKKVYRSLLSDDPVKQAEKFAWIDDLFFRGVRKLETAITGQSSCVARYRYEPGVTPTRGMCASLIGFWSQMLEMAGASNTKGAHPQCITRGAPYCEFAFEWQPRATGS